VVPHVAARVRARRGSPTGKASVSLDRPSGYSMLGVDSVPASQMRCEKLCEAEVTRNQVKAGGNLLPTAEPLV
jgi:hypothetical protein